MNEPKVLLATRFVFILAEIAKIMRDCELEARLVALEHRLRLRRVERLEARLVVAMPMADLPLSRLERHELLALQADYRTRFPGDVDDWDEAMLDDFLHWHTVCGGEADRMTHLQERCRTPQERAEDAAMAVAIDAMNWDTLDLFATEMAAAHG